MLDGGTWCYTRYRKTLKTEGSVQSLTLSLNQGVKKEVDNLLYNQHDKELGKSRAWWRTLVIPVLWEAETGGSGFAASLSSLSVSLSLSP